MGEGITTKTEHEGILGVMGLFSPDRVVVTQNCMDDMFTEPSMHESHFLPYVNRKIKNIE